MEALDKFNVLNNGDGEEQTAALLVIADALYYVGDRIDRLGCNTESGLNDHSPGALEFIGMRMEDEIPAAMHDIAEAIREK